MSCSRLTVQPTPHPQVHGKIVFHETGPWCQRGRGAAAGCRACGWRAQPPALRGADGQGAEAASAALPGCRLLSEPSVLSSGNKSLDFGKNAV